MNFKRITPNSDAAYHHALMRQKVKMDSAGGFGFPDLFRITYVPHVDIRLSQQLRPQHQFESSNIAYSLCAEHSSSVLSGHKQPSPLASKLSQKINQSIDRRQFFVFQFFFSVLFSRLHNLHVDLAFIVVVLHRKIPCISLSSTYAMCLMRGCLPSISLRFAIFLYSIVENAPKPNDTNSFFLLRAANFSYWIPYNKCEKWKNTFPAYDECQ